MHSFDVFDPKFSIQGKYFLEASAGTGKTFSIEHIILRALLTNDQLKTEHILAVTFTNAATNELKLRITKTLQAMQEKLAQAVNQETPDLPPYLEPPYNVKQLYMNVRNALATINRMSIFTIHGFCNYVLQQFSLKTEILTQNPALTTAQSALHHIRTYIAKNHWQDVLFPEQFIFLTAKHAFSTTFSEHVVELLFRRYPTEPTTILPSLQETWDSLCHWHTTLKESLQTIPQEAFLEQLLAFREKCKKIPTFATDKELEEFVTLLYASSPSPALLSFLSIAKTFSTENRKKRIKGEVSYPAFDLLSTTPWQQQTLDFCDTEKITDTLLYSLREYLKQHHSWWLSPDESIITLEQLLSSPVGKNIIHTLREQFRLVLIDEFQDTDKRQWSIFSSLFAAPEYTGSLFLIGDPKQSIYEWRNADLLTYLRARSCFTEDQQLQLTQNYRSSERLMQSINAFFSSYSPFLNIEGMDPITYHALAPQSTIEGNYSFYAPMHFFTYQQPQDLMQWINHTAISLHKENGISFGEMAILVSDTKQAQELMIHSELPVSFSKTLAVFDQSEAYFLVQLLLEALLTPDQYHKIQRVLLSSLFGLSLHEVTEKKPYYSALFFSLHHYLSQHGLLSTFYHLMQSWGEKLLELPHGDFLFQKIEYLCMHLDNKACRPYDKLFLLHYLAETGAQEEHFSSASDDPDTLKITTIHASKGLEYEVIFCPGLDKSRLRFPKSNSEILRETYVACTRAKKYIFIPVRKRYSSASAITKHFYFTNPSLSPSEKANPIPAIQDLVEQRPDLYSFSDTPPTSPVSLDPLLQQPLSFSITPTPVRPIFSFSSIKHLLNPEIWEESPGKPADNDIPRGQETGIIIHKILEYIAPQFSISMDQILTKVTTLTRSTHLEGYEQQISEMLSRAFSVPLTFAADTFALKDVSPSRIFSEEKFLLLDGEQLWQGVIDLFLEHNHRYYIIDWKTSFLGSSPEAYTQTRMQHYVEQQHLDYQASIYLQAAQNFLKQFSLSAPVEMGFVFIRGLGEHSGFLPIHPKADQKYPVGHLD